MGRYLIVMFALCSVSSPSASMIGVVATSRTAIARLIARWKRGACARESKGSDSRRSSAEVACADSFASRLLSSSARASTPSRRASVSSNSARATAISASRSRAWVIAFVPCPLRTRPPTSIAGPMVTTFRTVAPNAMPPPPEARLPPPRNARVADSAAAPLSPPIAAPVLATPTLPATAVTPAPVAAPATAAPTAPPMKAAASTPNPCSPGTCVMVASTPSTSKRSLSRT